MRNIGIDHRSGIATAAVSLPVFLLGFCCLLFFQSSSIASLFFALTIISCIATTTLGLLQSVWTQKTYARRLHKTTQALEQVSQGKTPEHLIRERYVFCSDIKQCPENHTLADCFDCELYTNQNDLEKIGVIARTLGQHIQKQSQHISIAPATSRAEVIELHQHVAYIRRDPGYTRHD